MSVSALVMEHGGGEDEAIAALGHDSVEDVGVTEEEIRLRFGDRVADIIMGCTKDKVDWKSVPADKVWDTMREGHLKYFEHLRQSFDSIRLVSACDKLHNCRDIVKDLEAGRDIFKKMKGGPQGTLWYYQELAMVFQEHGPVAIGKMIAETTNKMAAHVPLPWLDGYGKPYGAGARSVLTANTPSTEWPG
jgi:(p)ppGpp synthase/HD superfamily hydrolase